jgi:hypothetical protein
MSEAFALPCGNPPVRRRPQQFTRTYSAHANRICGPNGAARTATRRENCRPEPRAGLRMPVGRPGMPIVQLAATAGIKVCQHHAGSAKSPPQTVRDPHNATEATAPPNTVPTEGKPPHWEAAPKHFEAGRGTPGGSRTCRGQSHGTGHRVHGDHQRMSDLRVNAPCTCAPVLDARCATST